MKLLFKKAWLPVAAALGLGLLVLAAAQGWNLLRVTTPYVVKPLESLPAPADAKVGHYVPRGTRTLSIISSNDVVVIADPGASFHHEVVWLVERPRKDGAHTLREHRCQLPRDATPDHVEPLGSRIPPRIQQVADGEQW